MDKKMIYLLAAAGIGYYLYQKGYFRALMGQTAYTLPDIGLPVSATQLKSGPVAV